MTGPDRFEEMWNKATGYHPELVERWGQNIPRDELGQPKREVLQYLLSLPLDTSVQDKPQVKAVGPERSWGEIFEPVTGIASAIAEAAPGPLLKGRTRSLPIPGPFLGGRKYGPRLQERFLAFLKNQCGLPGPESSSQTL